MKILPRDATFLKSAGVIGPYVVVHAGTARPEKYWVAERWADVHPFSARRVRSGLRADRL